MTDENHGGNADSTPSKKKGLDLSLVLKHVAEADTPVGKMYLFPLRVSDLLTVSELAATDPVERIRALLPYIASFSPEYGLTQERVGIGSDQVSQLSVQTVETIAEVYAMSNELRSVREGGEDRAPTTRAADEPATAYLDRLIRNAIAEQANQFKKLREQVYGSTHSIFDQVRKASQALGDTRQQFERLTRATALPTGASPSFEAKSLEFNNHMAEHSARLARERSEDREMVRLTGQMTAQSAETLQELAAAASIMLEKLDQRDMEAKRTTKVQLWIAVGSVFVSALLAGASVFQDWCNNKSGDEWQGQVLGELRSVNKRSTKLEAENESMRKQVEYLNSALNAPGKTHAASRSAPPNKTFDN